MKKGDVVRFKKPTNERDRSARMILIEDADGFPKVLVRDLAHGKPISQAVKVFSLIKI